ncbi:MAG: ABC transporter permease subunit [Clostridia bacterium]|nr:ABC transporter permease subunit [Clostridia bacterium]
MKNNKTLKNKPKFNFLNLFRTKKKSIYFELFLCLALVFFVVVPLITMLSTIDGATVRRVFTGPNFFQALGNSFLTTIISTIISTFLAYILAWSILRTNIKCKGLFSVVLVLPMLIPSIAHGMGLVTLFGNNGLITNLFGIQSHLYGYWGIISGSVMYSFPIAFLMFVDILKYEDYTVYEAAEVLGIPKHKKFTSITLPYLKKPLISIIFTIFTMIITDYGIPLSVGGKVKTLPVLLYENTVGQLDYSAGALIGIFLLVPAIIAFLIDLFYSDKAKLNYVTKPFVIKKSKRRNAIAYTIVITASLFILLTICSFCIQAFSTSYPVDLSFTWHHFEETILKGGSTYLVNSVVMAMLTAAVGTISSFVIAYFSARNKTGVSRALHILSIISLAIPGLVLGLSYVILFKKSFIYGTLAILILANTVHFFASPYLMTYNALNKINYNLEDVGQVLNIPRTKIIFNVIVPQVETTLLEVFSYFFVNSMMTISAVSFLSTIDTKPLSLLINQFETFNMIECAAVVAIFILAVNILMKLLIYFIKKIGSKNKRKKV